MGGHGAFSDRSSSASRATESRDGGEHHAADTSNKAKAARFTHIATGARQNTPTTFMLRSEDEVKQSLDAPPSAANPDEEHTYGVESLNSNISSEEDSPATKTLSNADSPESELHVGSSSHLRMSSLSLPTTTPTDASHAPSLQSFKTSPLLPLSRDPSTGALSGPLTPYRFHSSRPSSASGPDSTPCSASLRSLRLSDDDEKTESSSQAVDSSGEEESEHSREQPQDGLPTAELIMPSMRMPQRRPFTERGKALGKLKLMVVGPSGCGKTSLIRAIVQCCDDIVHVDPPSQSNRSAQTLASSRPYPSWWAEVVGGGPHGQRRRNSSLTAPVLERNITFIDANTPDETSVHDHLESLFHRNLDVASLGDSESLSIFSGNGGCQVDAVLYFLSASPSSEQLDALANLASLTTVIPVLGKSDLVSAEEHRLANDSLQDEIISHRIDMPSLSSADESIDAGPAIWPVSALSTNDEDVMDASVLMNSEYIPPLAPSALKKLVDLLFMPDNAAKMRHLSAKKFLTWVRRNFPQESTSRAACITGNDTQQSTRIDIPSSSSNSRFGTQALVWRQGGRFARLSPTRWAADLQRSLRNERERYQRITSEDRRGWLIERWKDGSDEKRRSEQLEAQHATSRSSTHDPLGILSLGDCFRRRRHTIAQVLGGCGILGAFMWWAMRTWNWTDRGCESSGCGSWLDWIP